MNFINNTEKYSFLKGDWPMVEVSADGNTIYMGRPSHPDAADDDRCWFIKRIVIETDSSGNQIIETMCSDNNGGWRSRHSLTYKYC